MHAAGPAGLAVALALSLGACADEEPPGGEPPADPEAELRWRLGIEDDVSIHRVSLGGRGSSEHVVPARLEIEPGDVVEFVTVDGRVHTVRFFADSLSAAAAEFLRRTDQMQSPPLLERGARFVLTFRDAPSGRYPFRSDGGGGSSRGVVVVDGR